MRRSASATVFLALWLVARGASGEPEPLGAAPPPNPVASETLLLPGVANTLGTHTTRWRSDLVLKNPGAEPIAVRVLFLRGGNANDLESAPKRDYFLPAGDTKELKNVLATEFSLNGTGAFLVTASSKIFPDNPAGASVAGWVKTAAATLFAGGEIGGAIPSAPIVETARQIVHGLTHDGVRDKGQRAAIGVVNPYAGRGITVKAEVLDPDGEVLATHELNVPPLSSQQEAINVRLAGGTVRFTRTDGTSPFVAYATMVDNQTSDSSFLYGRPEAGFPAFPHTLSVAEIQH